MFPKGRGLFVFSDPGGAKPVLAAADLNTSESGEVLIVSDRVYPFFKDFKHPVSSFEQNEVQLIEGFRPDYIFTGTSYTSDIEQKFIRAAKSKNIHCASFVDHWTSMRKRFEDKAGFVSLPDVVYVIDERARKIAVGDGIEAEKIQLMANPYHRWLEGWRPAISRREFIASIGINQKHSHVKIALYAPDPLSNVDGKNLFGFDEISATADLLESMEQKMEVSDWLFTVKAHPNQDIEKLKDLFKPGSNFMLLDHDVDTNGCIYFSDVVIGFFSSILIESAIMKKKVLRFIPRDLINDPIKELQIGTIVHKETIKAHLEWN